METKTSTHVDHEDHHSTHYHYHQDKDALMTRMRRIEGQARGVQRMIEEDRYCPEIVQQLTSLSSAAREVSLLLLQHHIEGCVVDAVQMGESEHKIKELMGIIRKAIDQRPS